MTSDVDLGMAIVATWTTNNRVTTFLMEELPPEIWPMQVPGAPRRTVRMIAGHIHNARCMWIKWLGSAFDVKPPRPVDRHRVTRQQVIGALGRSGRSVGRLLERSVAPGGILPATLPYRNIPDDVVHFLGYLLAHEGHHRGQICLLARELGHRLPLPVTGGLWQWSTHAKAATLPHA